MFIPEDFIVPAALVSDRVHLRMLTADDVEQDYEAVMESIDHLKGFLDQKVHGRILQ